MDKATCETCKFWSNYCHRYPPQITFTDFGSVVGNRLPITGASSWCGEHKPKEGGGD